MTPEKNNPSQLVALAAFAAAILGIIGFFMPMFSFFGFEFNGLDLIDEMGDENIGIIIGVIGAGVAVLFGLMGMSSRLTLGIAAVGAIVAACAVFYTFNDQEMLDYADTGFWLFVIGEGACFVLSLVGMSKPKAD